jgi:hypothetical protein
MMRSSAALSEPTPTPASTPPPPPLPPPPPPPLLLLLLLLPMPRRSRSSTIRRASRMMLASLPPRPSTLRPSPSTIPSAADDDDVDGEDDGEGDEAPPLNRARGAVNGLGTGGSWPMSKPSLGSKSSSSSLCAGRTRRSAADRGTA